MVSLKRNENIVVAPADKGCAVVVMDKHDYEVKVLEHLSDENTYKKENQNPSKSLRNKINSTLKQLYDQSILNKFQYELVFAKTSVVPLFYALIKTHKPGNPIRPIVSFIESPSYNLAKFISNLLMPFTNNSPHKLKNSMDLKEKLQNTVVPPGYRLISFDVKSLFTCIPQDFSIQCIQEFLQSNPNIFQKTKMNIAEICKLVKLCFEAAVFSFNRIYYKQIKGTPMGSPVSVVLAEIVMQKIEQLIMPLIADSILFWYRYVNDVVACIKDNQSNVILRTINSINDHIQFTAEEESNSCLNYLDLQIFKKEDGSLRFNIFRKPTHTDKYLDFNSDHPLVHKHSVIRALVHRAEKLCDDEFKKQEMSHISKILQINGYPMNEINRISKKVTDKRPTMNNANSNVSTDKPSFTSVPYISGISERISRIFKKYDVNIAHLPTRKLKNELCHLKDKRKVGEKAGVVYKLDCKDCDARYVGETGRQVQDRMIEHQRDIAIRKKVSKVYEHVSSTGHNFDFDQVSILDSSNHKKIRLHLESIHSHLQPNSINRSLNLDNTYKPLLQ